jgi:hypothetical protein
MQLAMFYLGWASHLMQDQSVVHHTFDQPLMHHQEYENWADGDGSTDPPTWHGAFTAPPNVVGVTGIYAVPTVACTNGSPPACVSCTAGSPACFGGLVNTTFHAVNTLNAIDNEASNNGDAIGPLGTTSIQTAIVVIEKYQAGFYKFFFTAVGQPPVHMSAVMPAVNLLLI